MYGRASILPKKELIEDLTVLLDKHEGNRENPVLWETLSPFLLEKELKGIVYFKIQVEEIKAAYEMSQNRHENDYRTIMNHCNC